MGLMKRYLIYFSYIGSVFRGVQRQVNRQHPFHEDPSTVQGLIEYALERMKPKNRITLLLASRTDQGVHALKSACTVDIEFSYEPRPNDIRFFINTFFMDTDLPIRIHDVIQVPWDFNCRKAPVWRKYIYRFATIKSDAKSPAIQLSKKDKRHMVGPITENDRCFFANQSTFDVEAVRKVCELFVGTKDYITFMGKPKLQPQDTETIRCVHRLIVEPAHSYIPIEYDEPFNYWHLTCEGKSFLYNQIRRTVSVLLAVGNGKLNYDDVEYMFLHPSPSSFPTNLSLAPACGLYLADIHYNPNDLTLPDDIVEKIDEQEVVAERIKTNKELIKERLELLKLKKNKSEQLI